jgi:hypothetical protein
MTEQPKDEGKTEVNELKLHKILAKAMEDHTFGRSLADLTTEEKQALKPMLNIEFSLEASLIDEIPTRGLVFQTRKGLAMLTGGREAYSYLPSPIKYINKLQKELLIALGEYEGEILPHNNEKHGYQEAFHMYLNSIPEKQLGHVTEDYIDKMAVFGEMQLPPDENGEIRITLSVHSTFAENLEFFRQHLSTAVRLKNEREGR